MEIYVGASASPNGDSILFYDGRNNEDFHDRVLITGPSTPEGGVFMSISSDTSAPNFYVESVPKNENRAYLCKYEPIEIES